MTHRASVATPQRCLLGMTVAELEALATRLGMPRFKGRQMARRLYQQRVATLDEMTELSQRERRLLAAEGWVVGREAPLQSAVSADGTAKYLFRGAPGRDIEAVVIPDGDRRTICVSSQAGCRMACRFCMTGRGGFQGQLTAAQIVNQLLSVPESAELTNAVFMGMGEPLDNIGPLLAALEVMTAPWGLAWSPKRITVSTIGKLPELQRLLDETRVNVALSLHSPYPARRAEIMPVERAFPTADILALLRCYDWTGQRRLSIEYTMWRGVNDDRRHALALARLLEGLPARVNLIRFHAFDGYDGAAPTEEVMQQFRDTLNARGITATIRASRGEDIEAACGMLAGRNDERLRRALSRPLSFTPLYKRVVWGGHRILPYKGLEPNDEHIGESWELSALPGAATTVTEGELQGEDLATLTRRAGALLLGDAVIARHGTEFPLLLKIIDAAESLSVQVHPDKTEMWHIIDATPGAQIYAGLTQGDLTAADYDALVARGTFLDVVASHSSHAGDTFHIPPGRVHSIGAGNLLVEVQTPSDVTYRIHDYGRVGLDGKPRRLDTAAARQAIDYRVADDYRCHSGAGTLVSHEAFSVVRHDLTADTPVTARRAGDPLTIVTCIEGTATLTYDGGTTPLRRGHTLLLPALMGDVTIAGDAVVLVVTC